jgi:hypothetical protein
MAVGKCIQYECRHAAGMARRQFPDGALCSSSLYTVSSRVVDTFVPCCASMPPQKQIGRCPCDLIAHGPPCISALQMPYFGFYPVPSIVELSPSSLPRFGDASSVVYAFFSDAFAGLPPELVGGASLQDITCKSAGAAHHATFSKAK